MAGCEVVTDFCTYVLHIRTYLIKMIIPGLYVILDFEPNSKMTEAGDVDNLCELFKNNVTVKPKVLTEDLGKKFEMAICMLYDTPFNGTYKYDYVLPTELQPKLQKLKELFPQCHHTAKGGSRYDFTESASDTPSYLSAKTVKKGTAKVAPQVIGQTTPANFCNILQISYNTDEDLKCYIQRNIVDILTHMASYTFDYPNIYYHQQHNTIKYIVLKEPIDWNSYEYTWTRDWKSWNNSTVCKMITKGKAVSIVEFQFHSKSRKNMAIRWFYDNILELCKAHFEITDI